MFHTTKQEQIRDLHIDSFINSALQTSSRGYTPVNSSTAALEAEKQAVESRLKAEIAIESSKKK